MKTWQIALLAAGLVTGCGRRKLHWGDTRATTITENGFVVPIPAGWRDGAEATDEDMRELLAKQPGAHGLVKEDFDGATIVVKSGPTEPAAVPPCQEIASTIAKNESATAVDVKVLTIAGDGACQWTYKKDDVEGNYWLRYHDDKVIAIMCFTQGDKANLAACEKTRAALQVTAAK
jgi:hypothetical protein